ncbi:nitrilase-related carbon-nitrogen hydrolase [Sorangium sp. So ce1036]|uniref:nitrilase-related carbon-nitrogen hydrolase n=1 Tax=Sorangium sp. So ce1036 TaxID=3133328 RepID=UPI003F0D3A99
MNGISIKFSACGIASSALLLAVNAAAASAKVALIHSNPGLGEVTANVAALDALVEEAFQNGADIVVTPELATTGFSITREEAVDSLGFTSPYPELDNVRDLAMAYHGYVAVGIAEVTPSEGVYNTMVLFGPDGLIETQQKRGLSGWHDAGDIPFDVITTPYGDLGMLICSDSYLPDWTRIIALEGADIVLVPANWWGRDGQEEIWQTRARENGLWFLAANRWGTEVDERFGAPFTYYMNDAPSAAISPDGDIQLIYRTEDDPLSPGDTILYQTVVVPDERIGNASNPAYSLSHREPSAYGAIANPYYRRDLGYEPAPGLPTAGPVRVASMAYEPALFPAHNITTINQLWSMRSQDADVLVLPGLGVSVLPVSSSSSGWHSAFPWSALQGFVEQNGLSLLVTTAIEYEHQATLRESLVLVRPGMPPSLHAQIHDTPFLANGSGAEPVLLDLPNARVGVLTGQDALFPETGTHLAKAGADLVLITSTSGSRAPNDPLSSIGYHWDVDALRRMWKTRTNEVVHLAASDWTGNGILVANGGGYISNMEDVGAGGRLKIMSLDTSTVRQKFLNSYYPFDLAALLDD